MKIISDFVDFYDEELSKIESESIYVRYDKDREQRAIELRELREKGIETLKIKPVSSLTNSDELVVVYTDSKAHHGDGKIVTTCKMARQNYPNYSASMYEDNEQSLKVVSVGRIKINIFTSKTDNFGIKERKSVLIDRKRIDSGINKEYFISSIDYIMRKDGTLVATDFNRVENLSKLGIEDYISKEEIITEYKYWLGEV